MGGEEVTPPPGMPAGAEQRTAAAYEMNFGHVLEDSWKVWSLYIPECKWPDGYTTRPAVVRWFGAKYNADGDVLKVVIIGDRTARDIDAAARDRRAIGKASSKRARVPAGKQGEME